MHKLSYFVMAIAVISFVSPLNAQVDDEKDAYNAQVPTGMEVLRAGSKPGYKIVLPKGSAIRRAGDVRVLEGTGEYAARKFTEYDAIIAEMNDDIAALRKDVDELKNAVSKIQEKKLVSN